jgi:hypothetical protein
MYKHYQFSLFDVKFRTRVIPQVLANIYVRVEWTFMQSNGLDQPGCCQ